MSRTNDNVATLVKPPPCRQRGGGGGRYVEAKKMPDRKSRVVLRGRRRSHSRAEEEDPDREPPWGRTESEERKRRGLRGNADKDKTDPDEDLWFSRVIDRQEVRLQFCVVGSIRGCQMTTNSWYAQAARWAGAPAHSISVTIRRTGKILPRTDSIPTVDELMDEDVLDVVTLDIVPYAGVSAPPSHSRRNRNLGPSGGEDRRSPPRSRSRSFASARSMVTLMPAVSCAASRSRGRRSRGREPDKGRAAVARAGRTEK